MVAVLGTAGRENQPLLPEMLYELLCHVPQSPICRVVVEPKGTSCRNRCNASQWLSAFLDRPTEQALREKLSLGERQPSVQRMQQRSGVLCSAYSKTASRKTSRDPRLLSTTLDSSFALRFNAVSNMK